MLSKFLPYDIAYKATEDSAYKINEDFAKQPIKNPTTWLLSILPLGQGFWTPFYTGTILYHFICDISIY